MFWNYMWCPNDPCGLGIEDNDAFWTPQLSTYEEMSGCLVYQRELIFNLQLIPHKTSEIKVTILGSRCFASRRSLSALTQFTGNVCWWTHLIFWSLRKWAQNTHNVRIKDNIKSADLIKHCRTTFQFQRDPSFSSEQVTVVLQTNNEKHESTELAAVWLFLLSFNHTVIRVEL